MAVVHQHQPSVWKHQPAEISEKQQELRLRAGYLPAWLLEAKPKPNMAEKNPSTLQVAAAGFRDLVVTLCKTHSDLAAGALLLNQSMHYGCEDVNLILCVLITAHSLCADNVLWLLATRATLQSCEHKERPPDPGTQTILQLHDGTISATSDFTSGEKRRYLALDIRGTAYSIIVCLLLCCCLTKSKLMLYILMRCWQTRWKWSKKRNKLNESS